jgi:hypothetical protein
MNSSTIHLARRDGFSTNGLVKRRYQDDQDASSCPPCIEHLFVLVSFAQGFHGSMKKQSADWSICS